MFDLKKHLHKIKKIIEKTLAKKFKSKSEIEESKISSPEKEITETPYLENKSKPEKKQYPKDKEFCFICDKHYESPLDRFKCHYCEHYHCTEHRLPENHHCMGKPMSPGKGYRLLIGADGTQIIIGK
ncbi:MAG: hypothetical protein JW703_03030 [Candidatus Diapherotrites archaeon]|nr:hypothetical protein [Candidatus Diapherotrites archaeon]